MYAVRPLAEQEISVADLVLQVIAMKELMALSMAQFCLLGQDD